MTRKAILKQAIKHTCNDREADYGPPWDNLTNISELWTAYLSGKYDGKIIAPTGGEILGGQVSLCAEDVAWMMVLLKMARTFKGQHRVDTYEDAAAYSALAGECAQTEKGLLDE
jgi:hypothetical protein